MAHSIRNGFQWRDGRPRWEPSAASRAAGLKGRNLRDGDRWLDRGEAIDACDARHLWAGLVRDAAAGDEGARADLRRALAALQPPQTAASQLRRHLLSDLLDAATALLGAPATPKSEAPSARTVAAMVEGYFKSPPKKPDPAGGPPRPPAAETLRGYEIQSRKLLAKFGDRRADSLTRGELRAWYVDELCVRHGLHTANQVLAATAAFYKWAMWQTPPWVAASPATQLGRAKPAGRIVFWTMEEEAGFIPWCDAQGFADVADAAVLFLWTGASPVDGCRANLPELQGEVWTYERWKTRRYGRKAMPGLLGPVKARVTRRLADALQTRDRAFLVDPASGRRHDTKSLGARFAEARHGALMDKVVPISFADKRLQDTRDTCLSRLAWAGVDLQRIPSWSGHSPKDAEAILRDHYLALSEAGALEDARTLEAWARRQGVSW